MSTKSSPIIVKKRKVVKGGGHHGGAWKVAYADFVTAMMAFFLLMWLLNATTEDQRKGLADYFDPSIPMARVSGGGNDALNGDSIFSDNTLLKDGVGAANRVEARSDDGVDPSSSSLEELGRIEKEINDRKAAIEDHSLAEHIETRMTPDGLLIELIDREGAPLFEIGSATPSPLMQRLLLVVAPVISSVENSVEIIGHTDSRAYIGGAQYSNWELSADRATAARRLLIANGLNSLQIEAVIGKADVEPIADNPMASRNRRISVLLKSAKPANGPADL